MSPRRPPALADWLLDRSGFARQNPPLAGNLLEEFRSGRSAAWLAPDACCHCDLVGPERSREPASSDGQHHRLGSRTLLLVGALVVSSTAPASSLR
jgi:hypothetical protein